MNIVIAIDSFKGSLSSLQAGNAVMNAINRLNMADLVSVFPLADGGEGTVEALAEGLDGEIIDVSVTGPLFEKVNAKYAILKDNTAVIEMSAAAGLTLVEPAKRNPLNTTTFGVGELIKNAVLKGCRNFIVGIGGSATNDGGIGMLAALGYKFLNKNGTQIPLCGAGLEHLYTIDISNVMTELSDCNFKVACDVTNPLCGEKGCSAVFAPQKGATPNTVIKMDKWLKNYADITKTIFSKSDENFSGAGAAGGLGFAFSSFLNASLESGVQIVLDKLELEEHIKTADLVITGEGRLDSQTVMGKAPIGVAKLAKKYGKKVIAFSGCVTDEAEVCNDYGVDAFFPVLRKVESLEDALNSDNAYKNLTATAYQVFRVVKMYL